MNNELCRLTGADFPLFAFSHCRDVVAAVSRAGGFGVLGGSSFTPESLEVELAWIDAHVEGRPYGVDFVVPEKQAASAGIDTEELFAARSVGRLLDDFRRQRGRPSDTCAMLVGLEGTSVPNWCQVSCGVTLRDEHKRGDSYRPHPRPL